MVVLLKSLYLILAVACTVNSALGHGNHLHRIECGTPDPSDEELKNVKQRVRKDNTRRKSRAVRAFCVGCIEIEVAFHVVTDTKGRSDTSLYVTDKNIAHQVKILNQHFGETPFYFVHRETTHTVNDDWVYGKVYDTDLAATITRELRVGGPDVANLIYVTHRCALSFASYPWTLPAENDHIFLCPSTISPDSADYADAAHEIGHWLGLLHTFNGNSCAESNSNDFVDDTPQQSSPTNFCGECCDSGRDSCPRLQGGDLVNNFMDYTVCPSKFTPGQIERMYDKFNEYRRRLEPVEPAIAVCFSGSSTVQVHKKGQVALSSVQIGDLVHVGNGKYEPIYSFGHYDPTSRSTFFLQLQMNNEKNLVLSRHHLIFAADARFAIPASLVKVGDELLDGFGAKLSVVSIRAVVARGGLYAPFTPSGKIVVDGIMASSFAALGGGGNDTNVHSIAGVFELSHQWLAHSFEFPHRVACYYLARCPNEIYNGEGISVWVATPHKHGLWLLEQNLAVRNILLFLLAVMFLIFNVIEWVWLHPVLAILAVFWHYITFH